ncbi:hypothetical protein HOP50_02g11380 [Chloropicon primus]|uniref:Uncharacterized protein n=1 Tax=Chloropicon primus TaxID=1764295 RepID=A0A5B8MEP7_9CHLO|nr:hypothetical protein A3770_02p11520 [Chloropicon primus]UPQ97843.1 hypothetical protein HOP50_02g11380 [Chloropicon primus]|eukprot:QDZ18634.1 hypothetical protein A3770_02p11520 [Chloropicon primus]
MLRVNVSYTLEVEEDNEVNDSDGYYSSDDEAQLDSHFTHLQLCDEEDLYNTTIRSAEQALLTIHGNSFLDSENEDLGQESNLNCFGICNHEILNRIESDNESVSTDRGSLEEDEDEDEEDEDEGENLSEFEDQRSFHLSALPFRSQLQESDPERDESTSSCRGLYGPQEYDEDDLPNVPYRRVVRHQTRSGFMRQLQAGGYHQAEDEVPHGRGRESLETQEASLRIHQLCEEGEGDEDDVPGLEEGVPPNHSHVGCQMGGTMQRPHQACGVGFLNPFELACEVLRSAKQELEGNADEKSGESDSGCSYSNAEDAGPFPKSTKRAKPKERVKFVWQPYESFSQYNFHAMYSMKKKKKSRAENPLPAVGSALTGLVHMYPNKEAGKLPRCYFASKQPPVEYIKWREQKESEGQKKVALDRGEKGKLTLRRERTKSPLHASMLVAKHSSRAIVNASKAGGKTGSSVIVNHRRPSRTVGLHPQHNGNGSYLSNSSLLHDSSVLGGRKGVVRGLTFGRTSEVRAVRAGSTSRELRIQPMERRRS